MALDSRSVRTAVEADPEIVRARPRPLLLDEWQKVPEVWDVVRRAADDDPTGGQFLLVGSATPRPGATAHSGAGRIGRLRMRPMTLSERGVSTPSVRLSDLLAGGRPPLDGSTSLGLVEYTEEILASGFPGLRRLGTRALAFQLDSYLRNAVDRDVPEAGLAVRKPESMLAWLRAYAAATASTASYSQLLDAATPGQPDKPARSTSIAYRDVLTSLWLLDPVPAWTPTGAVLTRLGQAPKHHLADPALAARLLGLSRDALLDGQGSVVGPQAGTMLGHLFESLVTLCLRVAAQSAQAVTGHLRTRNGDHEYRPGPRSRRWKGCRRRGQAGGCCRRSGCEPLAVADSSAGRAPAGCDRRQHRADRVPASGRNRRRAAGTHGRVNGVTPPVPGCV
ncbi:DUF4143 domain-containing protein [Phycicoccus sp. CSK15P-2]|nr:DUF4143 domain-containing protein [Phycicoccus sp. CSK15P-2]